MPSAGQLPTGRAAQHPADGDQLGEHTEDGVGVHTDTGRHRGAGIEPSAGSIGDSHDNALAESVIGLYKTEVIRRRGPWRGLDDVEYATLEWVDWFTGGSIP